MIIELRMIDAANRAEVERLEVSESQKEFIASNSSSLETSKDEEYKEIARPFAIYANDELVGFTMLAFEMDSPDPDDRYWLWRFMIDSGKQGKGYGAAALEKIIEYFKSQGADHILLSTKETNIAALALYHKFQFAETGEVIDGEIVLQLTL